MKTDKFNNLLTVLLKYISISFQRPLKNLDSLLIFSDYNADIMLSRSWNNNSLHYAKKLFQHNYLTPNKDTDTFSS